jgi:hypothetical protein
MLKIFINVGKIQVACKQKNEGKCLKTVENIETVGTTQEMLGRGL